MNIQPVAADGTSISGTSNGNSSSATDYETMFMKLLSTELQSQDPTQTVDPTTMVTQMVEINQLSDVAGIYSLLQSLTSTSSAATNSGSQAGTHAAAATTTHAATTHAANATAAGGHGPAQHPGGSNIPATGTPARNLEGGN